MNQKYSLSAIKYDYAQKRKRLISSYRLDKAGYHFLLLLAGQTLGKEFYQSRDINESEAIT